LLASGRHSWLVFAIGRVVCVLSCCCPC
jgi:hypothetical protein